MMDSAYSNVDESMFAQYPEPPPLSPRRMPEYEDYKYLKELNNFIDQLGSHIRTIQEDVGGKMKKYAEDIGKAKDDTEARQAYEGQVKSKWKVRKAYRELVKDAIVERQRFLDSLLLQKKELELTRQKAQQLKALDDTLELEMKETREKAIFDMFSAAFLFIQVVLILAFVVATGWANNASGNLGQALRADDQYTFLFQIALLVLFGFGYLMIFLKKYGFTSVAGNFLLVAYSVQLGILSQLVWKNIHENHDSSWSSVNLTVPVLIDAFYVAATVAITFGAINGKASIMEQLLIATLEVFLYGLNYYIVIYKLHVVDPGGAMTIHLFGAYFGLAVSFWISKPFDSTQLRVSSESSSSYHSELMALIGGLFVFSLLPAFNAASAPDGSQYRVIVNTVVALAASGIFCLFSSRTIRRGYFHVREIQNGILAGGIAMASAHAVTIEPGAALLVGIVSGTVCTSAFVFFQPWMEKKFPFKVFDTRGVHNIHGIAGIIGGIAGAIATGTENTDSLFGQPSKELFYHGLPDQGGYQIGGLFVSLGIALGSGFIVGLALWLSRRAYLGPTNPAFMDEFEFHVPSDYPRYFPADGIPEP